WRRIKLVPFTVTIPEQEKDKDLGEKLKAERPGILAWAVRGCLDWQRDGLDEPEEVREATAAYRAEQDHVQNFLDECCVRSPHAKVKALALHEAFRRRSGEKDFDTKVFAALLRDKGFEDRRSNTGVFWHGIGLHASEFDESVP